MKVPLHFSAVVAPEKITDYLLSESHRDGRHKAAYFRGFGFTAERGDVLAAALLELVANNDVIRAESTPFGERFVVDGIMNTPDGRSAFVRTVWFVENDQSGPRLVTAYPAPIRR